MSRIDELIAEFAPDGVRNVALSEVAEYSPTRVDAADLDETSFVGVDNLVSNKGGRVDASYPPNTARLTAYEPGDILLGNIRPYLKKVWLATNAGGCSGDVLAVRIIREHRESLDPTFLYYLLSSDGFFAYNMQHAKGAKMPRGNKSAILNYRIPVPPLEVQREIVRVLDQFTQLEAELEAELEARRRQYEHYRSVITQGDGSARLSALGDHIDFGGRNVAPDRMPETTVSIYSLPAFDRGIGPELTTPADVGSAKSRVAEPSLLVAKLNPHIPRVWRVDAPDEGAYASPEFYQLIPKDNLSLEYLEHLVGASMSKLAGMVTGSTNSHKRLQREHIASLMVRIPSLREQAEASALLTRMHNLVYDLSVGLPAELAARRKQYEYYRDRLLTFEEAAA